MLRAARREFAAAGVKDLELIRVPGAYEIPVVAARLASRADRRPDAILCLGVVFQGETSHARHISEAVSHALAEIQVRHLIPVVHGVYHFDNEDQARVRCLGREHNRGTETARTALAMARLVARL
jgi:6,7-dimethyl-8-ribityllumazine synthase